MMFIIFFEISFLLFTTQNFLPLAKHVGIHGIKEDDVHQHENKDDRREIEGGVKVVRQLHSKNIMFLSIRSSCIAHHQFSHKTHGVGNDEESVPDASELT